MSEIDVTKKIRPPKPAAPAPAPAAAQPAEKEFRLIHVPSPVVAEEPVRAATAPDPVTGWLVVVKGMGRGRSLPLGNGIHSVGRGEDQRVAIRFGDKKISRHSHVEIIFEPKSRTFQIAPGHGRTFGYLNGQAIQEVSPLRAHDRIAMGDTELAFMPFCGGSFDWNEEDLTQGTVPA